MRHLLTFSRKKYAVVFLVTFLLLALIVPWIRVFALTISNSSTATGIISVVSTLTVSGTKSFLIDHPLDPRNKLLYHYNLESPDVKNIYDGIATLDEQGEARVELPDYFFALNRDFRYLATPLGEPMPGLYLSGEVRRKFYILGSPVVFISGGKPGGRVSWQITGIRHDPYIVAHPILPEVVKGPDELVDKGEYLLPEYYEK